MQIGERFAHVTSDGPQHASSLASAEQTGDNGRAGRALESYPRMADSIREGGYARRNATCVEEVGERPGAREQEAFGLGAQLRAVRRRAHLDRDRPSRGVPSGPNSTAGALSEVSLEDKGEALGRQLR